jgi:hypothetical protein
VQIRVDLVAGRKRLLEDLKGNADMLDGVRVALGGWYRNFPYHQRRADEVLAMIDADIASAATAEERRNVMEKWLLRFGFRLQSIEGLPEQPSAWLPLQGSPGR